MAYLSHSFTIDDALARNQDVCEVEIDDWGFRTVPAGMPPASPNLQFPPPGSRALPSTLAAIAIGPRSTIDRCWVSWDRQKVLVTPPSDEPDPQAKISSARIVTVGAPLLFSQATTIGTLSQQPTGNSNIGLYGQSVMEAMQRGLMYVFPWGSAVDPIFNKWAESTQQLPGDLGESTVLPENYRTMFASVVPFTCERPRLHLLLYLKLPGFAPPTKRAPIMRNIEKFLAGGADTYLARIPVFGRKNISLQVVSGVLSDYTVGLVRNVSEGVTFEVKAAEDLAVPANETRQFTLNNQGADYVTLHAKSLSVNPAPRSFLTTIVAED
jgi:hypothetical protein